MINEFGISQYQQTCESSMIILTFQLFMISEYSLRLCPFKNICWMYLFCFSLHSFSIRNFSIGTFISIFSKRGNQRYIFRWQLFSC